MKRAKVSVEEFVRTYATATCVDDVVKATGLGKLSVQTKARTLRKLGVQLPKLGRVKEVVDVAALNALLKELKAPAKRKK